MPTELTTRAQEVLQETNKPAVKPIETKSKGKNAKFRSSIDSCKNYKKKVNPNWIVNIDFRRGKPFASQSDEDRIVVNLDWSLTKAKQAVLFSQVPQARVNHPPDSTDQGPWVHAFERKLNDVLISSGIETAFDECLPDCINAAGVGIVMVGHESLTQNVEVPSGDPMLGGGGSPVGIPRVSDSRYLIQRISPFDFLWPVEFTGADFDNCSWIGRSGRVTWAEAVRLFDLKEEDKKAALGEDLRAETYTKDELDKDAPDDKVGFDEIWYKEYQYDPEATSYSSIHHLVFVNGKTEAVIDKPWEGQKQDEQGQLLGVTRFPLQVLTLAYITDDAIPPSDSAIGRSQVNEINMSRTQMIQQRQRSIPVRWFDVNRVDPALQQTLMRGTWQGMIPVQGQGNNIIGEVARSVMPNEDFNFDQIAKSDLTEAWSIGANQLSSGKGIETAAESTTIEQNFQTRVGRERARVASFFVKIAEVVGGLICLYESPQTFGEGFDPQISRALRYSILADSTVLLDSNQRLQKLMQFINFTAKSGWVDIGSVLKEVATLSGLDPNVVIKPPQPKPPVEPSITLALKGAEDMLNPLTLAFLLKSGQGPEPQLIEQAKQMIAMALAPPPAPQPQGPQDGMGSAAEGMGGPPMGGMPPSGPQDVGQVPSPPPPAVGDAHPNWEGMSRINKRIDQSGGGGA